MTSFSLLRRTVVGSAFVLLLTGAGHAAEGFVDTFERFDPHRWYVSDGWRNGDHMNCNWSKRDVAIGNGKARLRFIARTVAVRENTCAEIQTRDRFGFGTYETRLRTPVGSGVIAAFFTYMGVPRDEQHNEIDLEFMLKDPALLQLNTHVDGKGGNEHMVRLDEPADEGFRNYAFIWEPERIVFFVDGQEVHRIEDPKKIPQEPKKIFFSIWGSDTLSAWMGRFEAPAKPLFFEIDRISFTPLGEACPDDATACAPRS